MSLHGRVRPRRRARGVRPLGCRPSLRHALNPRPVKGATVTQPVPQPPPTAGPTLTPIFADLRRTFATLRADSTAPWRATKDTAALMRAVTRERHDAAIAERGRVVAAEHGLPGLVVPGSGDPDFLYPLRDWKWPRLLDHETWYRVTDRRGPLGRKNLLVTTEPYFLDEQVPAALAEWIRRLAPVGLTVKPLSKDLLVHCPDSPHSQIFLLGSPDLIA